MRAHARYDLDTGPGPAAISQRTWISRLSLTNFRNYAALNLAVGPGNVVLVGHNGAGKTNCLEALSLLNPGRGLRGQPQATLARQGGDGTWAVAVKGHSGEQDFALGTGVAAGAPSARPSRTARIDGAPARSSGALAERLRLVWLTPAMDGLFTGPAADRRRFLDRIVLSFEPSFAAPAAAFERAMRQRNCALEEGSHPSLLDSLEMQMAEAAVTIVFQRRAAVQALAELGAQRAFSRDTAFPGFGLGLQCSLDEQAAEGGSAVDIEDWYAQRLRQGRERDRAARRTLSGPHRSDLAVVHGVKQMPAALCSTGEQKALLLGLILAQARLVKTVNRGIAPLILLDEVAAHLDDIRREALFAEIAALDAQAWMTGTDLAVFAPLSQSGSAQVFLVSNGAIRAVEDEESRHNH